MGSAPDRDMAALRTDLSYAFRLMRKSPGFSALAIGSLALGIAANVVIFSIVNGVLLKPLEFPDLESLYTLFEVEPRVANLYPELPVNPQHAENWKKTVPAISELGLAQPQNVVLGAGQAVRVPAVVVTPDFLKALGVRPMLGRLISPSDAESGRSHVVLLTYALWKGRFGGKRDIIGQQVRIEGFPHRVVGVMAPSFRLPTPGPFFIRQEAELLRPLVRPKDRSLIGDFNYDAIVRLKPNVSRETALAEFNASLAAFAKTFPERIDIHADLIPLSDYGVKDQRRALIVLLGAVGAVLLVVCLNLAALMVAKGELRSQEMAVRTALGATRGRLIRQSITEALVYAIVGGAIGIWLAALALKPLLLLVPDTLPRRSEVGIDHAVLLFALGLIVLTALIFGMYPAWQQSRGNPQEALGATTRSSTISKAGIRGRSVLIGIEVGLSTALLVMAGILAHSFVRLMNVHTGFTAQHGLSAQIDLPAGKYRSSEASNSFYARLLTQLKQQPGIEAAGLTSQMPLDGETWMDGVSRPGDVRPTSEKPTANVRFVSPAYFSALGIPVESGRTFEEQGRERKNAVIISRVLAKRLWPHEDPVGQTLMFNERATEVVGVVADTRANIDKQAPLVAYVPYWSNVLGVEDHLSVVVRSNMSADAVAGILHQTVASLDEDVPVSKVRTFGEVKLEALASRRFHTMLAGVFAGAALLVAALGIFGVIASVVAARRNEIGIRMALGATSAGVVRMVLRQGMMPVALGIIGGIVVTVALGSLMQALLYEVSPSDPITVCAVVVLLAIVAALACWIPARQAARIDPIEALRYQ
ncbi:MAG TPA: ABC transporter permease [Bryobacteraceae bacterium]|nr:ABC transporter permease [Bryobacteraceae bacterium]